jgi:hypothetical protein
MIGRNLYRMIGSYNRTWDLRPLVKRGINLAGMVYGRTSTNDPFLVLFDGTRWPSESILAADWPIFKM